MSKVKLYIYDLSRGMAAAALSLPAIYHTSIVAYGREWYYGQGILNSRPGSTHHGQPMEVLEMGHTEVDEETFREVLRDLEQRYTASAYHLLRFNCNTFSNEVAGILLGTEIPPHIISLPQDFLNTPMGRILGPSIEAMFPPMGPSAAQESASIAAPAPAAALRALNGVTQSAAGVQSSSSPVVSLKTNAELQAFLASSECAAVLFTSESCPPCAMVKPVIEELASKHAPELVSSSAPQRSMLFGRVDAGPGSALMSSLNVRATPTVQFFTGAKMRAEVKGADVAEIKSQADLTLWEVYRPHPHSQLKTPVRSARKIPTSPLLSSAVPNLKAVLTRLEDLVAKHSKAASFSAKADEQDAMKVLRTQLVPWLEQRFTQKGTHGAGAELLHAWDAASATLEKVLPVTAAFPLVDLLRLAVLDTSTAAALAARPSPSILHRLLLRSQAQLDASDASSRAALLTSLRLLCNALASPPLHKLLMDGAEEQASATSLLVTGLLHADAGVHSAAANAAFNAVLSLAATRPDWIRADGNVPAQADGLGGDWESEVASALLEAIKNEEANDETLHRLSAALLLLLHNSSYWQAELAPLMEALDAAASLNEKTSSETVLKSAKKEDLVALLKDAANLCQ